VDSLETNTINDKIEVLNKKIEYIEKYFFAEKKLKNKDKNITDPQI
jgi:hypothetical protein